MTIALVKAQVGAQNDIVTDILWEQGQDLEPLQVWYAGEMPGYELAEIGPGANGDIVHRYVPRQQAKLLLNGESL